MSSSKDGNFVIEKYVLQVHYILFYKNKNKIEYTQRELFSGKIFGRKKAVSRA